MPPFSLPAAAGPWPRAILIDLAGVLHVGNQAIPGAVEALGRLRATGIPLRFLTNTTRSPRSALVRLLQGLGFDIQPEELRTAVQATCQLVKDQGLHPYYLVHPDIREEVGPDGEDPDAVVLGDAGAYFSFDAMNKAFRLIMAGHPFIAMARNRYFQEADGLTLDLGGFVAALECGAGVAAEVAGKPAALFFLSPLQELGVPPGEAVLIGDDWRDDVLGAQSLGIPGILVKTGKYRPGDETRMSPAPAKVVADFPGAVDYLLSLMQVKA